MSKTSSLFSQILSIIDRHQFERLVKKHGNDCGSKGFKSWEQLVSMLFCQLAQAKSLREIEFGLKSCEGKVKHLGIKNFPKRSTLSYANEHRNWELYRDLFHVILKRAQRYKPGHKFRFKNPMLSLDSTVISLCMSMFDWAKYRTGKGAVKLHMMLDHDGFLPSYAHITEGRINDLKIAQQLNLPKGTIVAMDRAYVDYKMFDRWTQQGVFFVTRTKSNTDYCWTKERPLPKNPENVTRDDDVILQPFNLIGDRITTKTYRVVVVWNQEHQKEIELITNIMHLSCKTIAEIYRQRWQIELFFKAIKQNLKIKTFVGTSENAVHIQIWTALISIVLLRILQLRSKAQWAFSNLVALLRWNLFTYRDLWTWIDRPFDGFDLHEQSIQSCFNLDST